MGQDREVRLQMLSRKGDLVRDQLAYQEQTLKENLYKDPPNYLTRKRKYDRDKG